MVINSVIIPAGGSGSRMQLKQAKQYLSLAGKTILEHTLDIFQNAVCIDEIVLVLPALDVEKNPKSFWQNEGYTKIKHCVPGGDSRQASVYQGMQHVNEQSDYVLIHDAARCLFNANDLTEALKLCEDVDGVIYATPVSDSIKRVQWARIEESIDRNKLWAMQTPQIFKREFIVDAYRHAHKDKLFATDDAQVAEYVKGKIKVFESKHPNLKLTQAADIPLFEALLNLKGKHHV